MTTDFMFKRVKITGEDHPWKGKVGEVVDMRDFPSLGKWMYEVKLEDVAAIEGCYAEGKDLKVI